MFKRLFLSQRLKISIITLVALNILTALGTVMGTENT
jgi:hypothetical protein